MKKKKAYTPESILMIFLASSFAISHRNSAFVARAPYLETLFGHARLRDIVTARILGRWLDLSPLLKD